jgi:hypothetical protein
MLSELNKILQFMDEHSYLISNPTFSERYQEANTQVSAIFSLIYDSLEIIPDYIIVSHVNKSHLMNSIKIVEEYWNKGDVELFNLNWALFFTQWKFLVDCINITFDPHSLDNISPN